MKRYDPTEIEPKWQQVWADTKLYQAQDGDQTRPKYYMLTEFPYPSAAGLHAGHVREYTIGDVIARNKRMQGYNTLYPMGWDAFGLPTENYAIKMKIKPQDATRDNLAIFRRQLQSLGLGIDWDREVNTSDPGYYKWTQWLFLQFLKAGLAYQDEIPINWCPKEKTGLANEEVVNGLHERCGTPVEKKTLKQWMLKITAYADRLIEGLKTVDFPPRIADQQINWIGRSEGAEIDSAIGEQPHKIAGHFKFRPNLVTEIQAGRKWVTFRLEPKDFKVGDVISLVNWETGQTFSLAEVTEVQQMRFADVPLEFDGHEKDEDHASRLKRYSVYYQREITDHDTAYIYRFKPLNQVVTVYTTRPDTLAGATFLVLAPEHPAVAKITTSAHKAAVQKYTIESQRETELQRQEEERPKTGVFTGAYAENPVTHEKMPVWVADYVLMGYGTGAIMAVPAHDDRDFAFAKAHDLPIKVVVEPVTGQPQPDPEFRRSIVAIVQNPRTGELLTIHWGESQGGTLFVGGGADENEHLEATARREIEEETGYRNLRLVAQSERIHHHYIAHSKGKRRKIEATGFFFQLENEDRVEPKLERDEAGKFTVKWLSADEAERAVTDELHGYLFKRFIKNQVYTGEGPLVSSGRFDGLSGTEAKRAVTKWLFDAGLGRGATKFRLRDWIFSRQHYWGEPIPVVHCPKDGVVPVPDDQLPVTLPDVEHYEPTDTGESPLAAVTDWVNTTCPTCGGPAKRETDTMPNWAGSSWYWLRYADPKNDQAFADPAKMAYWTPVDLYLGGMEHTTLHLLYSRFWNEFLYDQKLVPTPEPYAARRGQGIVLAADGRKMSKSFGNVINPTDIIARYGADAFRLYIMFMAPYDETTPWSDERLNGVSRFVYRVWTLAQELLEQHGGTPDDTHNANSILATEVDRATHKTLKKVHDDLEGLRFNTYVSTLMEYVNFLTSARIKAGLLAEDSPALARRTLNALVLMLAPAAPHITEELWHQLGHDGSVHVAPRPAYDPELLRDELVTIIVQVNGKLRGQVAAAPDTAEADLINLAAAEPHVAAYLEGQKIAKTIVVPRKLVNFVVR